MLFAFCLEKQLFFVAMQLYKKIFRKNWERNFKNNLEVFMYRKLFALSLFFAFTAITNSAQETSSGGVISRAVIVPGFNSSYLGVQTVEITKQNYTRFGLTEVRGVAVDEVLKDSPAEKAGIQNGDVIVRFDGETISSVRKLTRLLGEVSPDHKVKLTVLRNGNERDIEVTLAKREMDFNAGVFSSGNFPQLEIAPIPRTRIPNATVTPLPQIGGNGALILRGLAPARQIGVSISTLSKQLGEYFGISDGKGLLVRDVRPDSPAAKGGIKAGDVIVEIDGKQMTDGKDLIEAVNEKKEGTISVTIVRDKNRQTLTVEPGKAIEKYLVSPDTDSDN